jgi:hypothetical protein
MDKKSVERKYELTCLLTMCKGLVGIIVRQNSHLGGHNCYQQSKKDVICEIKVAGSAADIKTNI